MVKARARVQGRKGQSRWWAADKRGPGTNKLARESDRMGGGMGGRHLGDRQPIRWSVKVDKRETALAALTHSSAMRLQRRGAGDYDLLRTVLSSKLPLQHHH
jgi:hypothetical protein